MALELRNRLEAGLGIPLPATIAWNYPTVALLAPYLAERLEVPLEDTRGAAGPADAGAGVDDLEVLLKQVEQLSAEDARRLLSEGS
jgi:polyketide synthase 12/myxalamid-type polyketide synthase MxaF